MKRRERGLKRILMSDPCFVSVSPCAPQTRRVGKATSGPYWLNSDCVEGNQYHSVFSLENGSRLKNYALSKIIILIQIMGICIICGGRVVLRVLLFVHGVSGYIPFSHLFPY